MSLNYGYEATATCRVYDHVDKQINSLVDDLGRKRSSVIRMLISIGLSEIEYISGEAGDRDNLERTVARKRLERDIEKRPEAYKVK